MYGADIYMPAPVTGLELRSDGRWDVQTPYGTIKAKQVVKAAGNRNITQFTFGWSLIHNFRMSNFL